MKTLVYRRKEKLPWQQIDDQVIIINPQQQKVHELNEVASFVWQKLDGKNSLTQIVAELPHEFEDIPVSAAVEVEQLMDDLHSEGLVECL